jgi:hypothetical protein
MTFKDYLARRRPSYNHAYRSFTAFMCLPDTPDFRNQRELDSFLSGSSAPSARFHLVLAQTVWQSYVTAMKSSRHYDMRWAKKPASEQLTSAG